jgi:hypothetical protein
MMRINIIMRRSVVARIDERASRVLFHIDAIRAHGRDDRSRRRRHFHFGQSTRRACKGGRVVHQILANRRTFAEKDRYRVAFLYRNSMLFKVPIKKTPSPEKKSSTSFTGCIGAEATP